METIKVILKMEYSYFYTISDSIGIPTKLYESNSKRLGCAQPGPLMVQTTKRYQEKVFRKLVL